MNENWIVVKAIKLKARLLILEVVGENETMRYGMLHWVSGDSDRTAHYRLRPFGLFGQPDP